MPLSEFGFDDSVALHLDSVIPLLIGFVGGESVLESWSSYSFRPERLSQSLEFALNSHGVLDDDGSHAIWQLDSPALKRAGHCLTLGLPLGRLLCRCLWVL